MLELLVTQCDFLVEERVRKAIDRLDEVRPLKAMAANPKGCRHLPRAQLKLGCFACFAIMSNCANCSADHGFDWFCIAT